MLIFSPSYLLTSVLGLTHFFSGISSQHSYINERGQTITDKRALVTCVRMEYYKQNIDYLLCKTLIESSGGKCNIIKAQHKDFEKCSMVGVEFIRANLKECAETMGLIEDHSQKVLKLASAKLLTPEECCEESTDNIGVKITCVLPFSEKPSHQEL